MDETNEIDYRKIDGFAKGKRLPWSVCGQQAQEVLDGFAALGIAPNPSSRVARYPRLLRECPVVDERTLYRLLHYRIDVRMLRTILRRLGDCAEFRPLIAAMVSGSEVRTSNELGSARDIQFQLYLAAVLRRAGFTVSNQEPDIGAIVGPRKFAVAAKRIRSPKKLVVRVKEGIDQIRRSGLQGWVALDLTLLAANPDDLPVNESSVDLQNIPELYLKDIAPQLLEVLQLVDGVEVLGVQFCFFTAGLSVPPTGGPGLSTSFSIFPMWGVTRGTPLRAALKLVDDALKANSGPA